MMAECVHQLINCGFHPLQVLAIIGEYLTCSEATATAVGAC